MIADARIVMTTPLSHGGMENVVCSEAAIELDCVRLPIPKEAKTAKKAKSHPSTEPTLLLGKPCFMVYIGPPAISPFAPAVRYFKESIHSLNFVVSPNAAEIHIHTRAPGPPDTIAVATPTMLPVPIVAASAVVSAPNGETSPAPCFWRASLLSTSRSA